MSQRIPPSVQHILCFYVYPDVDPRADSVFYIGKGKGGRAFSHLSERAETERPTGYRVTTIAGASIIVAAHIHQFSQSRNNDPKNGIALCKNAHWMFDQGLWSLDDENRAIVAHSAFDENTHGQKSLRDFHGLRIDLPSNPKLWPDPLHLAWHREYKFCA